MFSASSVISVVKSRASLVCFVVNAILVLWKNPGVIAARGKVPKSTWTYEKIILPPYMLLFLGLPVVAGLDAVRFEWSSLPFETTYAGIALLLLALVPVSAALVTNPYLEGTMRIQEEKGHTVITTGPYRLVRHPMYVGMILLPLSTPLALGSVWAFLPAGVMALLMVVRTAFEDRALTSELPGYREYAQRTRYRLLPGIW